MVNINPLNPLIADRESLDKAMEYLLIAIRKVTDSRGLKVMLPVPRLQVGDLPYVIDIAKIEAVTLEAMRKLTDHYITAPSKETHHG